jgi:uncharacterized protein (DUF885 family)
LYSTKWSNGEAIWKPQSSKFQDTKNKEHEKTQKQIKDLKDFNKHQCETKDTIKGEIYELKMTTKHKRGVEQRYGKLQKKESNRNPGNQKLLLSNKKHSGRPLVPEDKLEQVEDRISELKNKIEIKGKKQKKS